jgi:hypothetical protein
LANYIVGKRKDLHLIIPPLKIHRSDPLELQQKILAMSSDERKRLDINKSTLWYQWKHLNEGKRIQIYGKVLENNADRSRCGGNPKAKTAAR